MALLEFLKRSGSYKSFYHSSSLIAYPTTDGVSEALHIPPLPSGSRLRIFASPGSPTNDTVAIEYSMSSDDDVLAGTADWFPWSAGDVAVDTLGTLDSPITGIRFKNTSSVVGGSSSDFAVII